MFKNILIKHKRNGVFFLSSNTSIQLKISFQNYFLWILHVYIQISANCKIIPACSCPQEHNCCGEWEGWDPVNWFNHTSWVAIVTPTDRLKSVRNRCVIKVFGGVFVLSQCVLDLSVVVGTFVIRLFKTDLFLFL